MLFYIFVAFSFFCADISRLFFYYKIKLSIKQTVLITLTFVYLISLIYSKLFKILMFDHSVELLNKPVISHTKIVIFEQNDVNSRHACKNSK